jgi:hypothetical protein
METISQREFETLCDDIYRDRELIFDLNPGLQPREATLWMLLGCLISLLSVPVEEQSSIYDPTRTDPYFDAVLEVLKARTHPTFDPPLHMERLLAAIGLDETAGEQAVSPTNEEFREKC